MLKRVKMNVSLVLGFLDEDKLGTIQPHDDALVVTLRIGGYDVKRVMIDQGSAAEIIYPDLYKGLDLKHENLTAYSSPLVSFKGKMVVPKGQIRLPMQVSIDVVKVDFIVMDAFSPYTAIMGRPWLHTLGAVSSTLHQKVKYPSEDQVLEILESQSMARQCLVVAIQHRTEAKTSAAAENDLQQLETPASLFSKLADEVKCEDLEKVVVEDDPEKLFQVGAQMPLLEKEQLVEFLRKNVDVFAWNAYEAQGVDPNFICHHLNVNPFIIPRRQPPRRPSKEHAEAVKNEVTKLKQAGAIKEVFYPQWLANTVVVKKKTGKWRVCVDFTDLNKACPKVPFPKTLSQCLKQISWWMRRQVILG